MDKFVPWGLIEGQRAETIKPLTEHIKDYIKIFEARGQSRDYIKRNQNRLKKIMSGCRFYYFRDITKSAVEMYLGRMKKDGYSDTSRGHYLDALKTFLNWAEEDRRIIRNLLIKMKKPKRDSEMKGVLTAEQFVRLIKTTFEKNIILCNKYIGRTTGEQRAVLSKTNLDDTRQKNSSFRRKTAIANSPKGIRTPVAGLKTRCPGPA